MNKRIFWKFFAAFFLLSVFLSLAFYFLVVGQARAFYLQTQKESLARLGGLVRAELAAAWPFAGEGALDSFIKEKGRQSMVRLTVIDLRGRVLADSQRNPAAMQDHADRPEVAAALSGRSSSETRFSFTLGERMLYHALPLQVGSSTVAVLRLSQFIRTIDQMFSFWRYRVTFILSALLFVSLLGSLLLSRSFTRPIRGLARAARAIGDGTWHGHVPTRRRDELGRLETEFNAMADRQQETLEKLERSQHELETILGSVSDGLLVIDARERIVRAGPHVYRLIGETDLIGKPYWEILRSKEFSDLVRQAATSNVRSEIEIRGRVYLASLSPLPGARGTVITFHDLSESRRLERQKKDFVANVSHELRTPLTAIKGYAETLAEDAEGEARKYLDVILRHADRLIDLTRDLLSLSELEEKEIAPRREVIDWPGVLAGIRILFDKKLLDKKLALDVVLANDLDQIAFKGDRFRLEQMFINLLDNAVKYTDKGGITIRIAAAASRLIIEFRDSGVGIAPEHLPRIFERFYVIDKARSRQSGGTGLGLAIVKHIVSLHGGEITAESVQGEGSIFTISLPLA